MALAALPVTGAVKESVTGVVKVLSTDIIVVRGRVYRRVLERVPTGERTKSGRLRTVKVERLEPIDLEFHANPIGIGVLGLASAIVGFFAFGRLELPSPTGGPIKVYAGPFADEFDAWKARFFMNRAAAEEERLRAEFNEINALTPTQRVGELSCDELKARTGRSYSQGHISEGDYWREVARLQGCDWAKGS